MERAPRARATRRYHACRGLQPVSLIRCGSTRHHSFILRVADWPPFVFRLAGRSASIADPGDPHFMTSTTTKRYIVVDSYAGHSNWGGSNKDYAICLARVVEGAEADLDAPGSDLEPVWTVLYANGKPGGLRGGDPTPPTTRAAAEKIYKKKRDEKAGPHHYTPLPGRLGERAAERLQPQRYTDPRSAGCCIRPGPAQGLVCGRWRAHGRRSGRTVRNLR